MPRNKSFLSFYIFVFLTILLLPARVRAAGELNVQFENTPLFHILNMLPGDDAEKQVTVTNNGLLSRFVAIKAGKQSPDDPLPPAIEKILEVIITDGTSDLYGGTTGMKTVDDFFADSQSENGILLSLLNPGQTATYRVKVKFPFENADQNHYQGKSVLFLLTLGIIKSDNLVINEVYYQVDEDHGLDSPLDRGIVSVNGNNITVIISDTGAGSTNTAVVKKNEVCNVIQENNGVVINNINLNQNTGNNQTNNNTGLGSIITGSIFNFINIFNFGNINIGSCGKKLGQNDEWVEIYNPTGEDISLKNWKLVDNSGLATVIHGNNKVKAGGFALLSKASSTWRLWDENRSAKKISLGKQIGDGLDNDGDILYLINSDDEVVDAMAWGDDTAVWNPAVPLVSLGASMERLTPGFDTDLPDDWEERDPPTPGE